MCQPAAPSLGAKWPLSQSRFASRCLMLALLFVPVSSPPGKPMQLMIHTDLERHIIRPVLKDMGDRIDPRMNSEASVVLLIGTAAHESHGGLYAKQIKGPAVGIYQIEPNTHKSKWQHYLRHRKDMQDFVLEYVPPRLLRTDTDEHGDFVYVDDAALLDPVYATIMARLIYWPAKEPLPKADDILGLGKYWDSYYNRNPKKGFPYQFVRDLERYRDSIQERV